MSDGKVSRTSVRGGPPGGAAEKRGMSASPPFTSPRRPADGKARPESSDPTVFALGSLGWKAFQDLCGTVLGAVLGQTVTAFRPTRDAGRDFAFEGQWVPQGGEALGGRFVVQCKFKARGSFFPSDLSADLPKVRRLVRSGLCDSYVIMTNAGLTAATAATLETKLTRQGVRHTLLIGGDQLDRYIRENARLRALVPRLYSLGDLTQILDERRYEQAAALLAAMRDDISKFVITTPYQRAVDALMAHGFVFLIGAPAAGKSMIAAALAAASLDMWDSRPMKIESAAAFSAAWNPHEPNQFFWIDDAFGATQYQRHRTDEWNQLLTNLKAAVSRGAKIVMTSRDYIWAEAADDLKLGTFPPLQLQQIIVDVHDLQLEDKRQILYNHLKYGTQPREFRRAVKPFLDAAARVDVFLPEVARRFGDPQFTHTVRPSESIVVGFFEHPVDHLKEVVAGLGRDEFAALAVVFMARGSRESPFVASDDEVEALVRLGSTVGGVLDGLAALRGSLVTLGPRPDGSAGSAWAFTHPTIGDAVQQRIVERPELLTVYLRGSPLDSLLAEITCGEVGLKGSLVVPESCFEVVARRLEEGLADRDLRRAMIYFAVTRCSRAFLDRYKDIFMAIEVDAADPGMTLMAGRLNRLGLLTETVRARLVSYWSELAIDWLDLEVLTNAAIRELLRPDEMNGLLDRLRNEVINNLAWFVDVARDGYDGRESPDDVVGHLQLVLETLVETYPDDHDVAEAVAAADDDVRRLKDRLDEDWRGDPGDEWDEEWGDRQSPSRPADVGVFSDVDE